MSIKYPILYVLKFCPNESESAVSLTNGLMVSVCYLSIILKFVSLFVYHNYFSENVVHFTMKLTSVIRHGSEDVIMTFPILEFKLFYEIIVFCKIL